MRWFVLMLILVVSDEIRAEEVFVIPENNPKPIYPLALQRAGVVGTVRVGFTVKADGSVSKVRIVQSDHPDLAEATRVAIAQWRFKPWTVEGGKPAEQDSGCADGVWIRLGFIDSIPIKWLNELRCRDLNEALVACPGTRMDRFRGVLLHPCLSDESVFYSHVVERTASGADCPDEPARCQSLSGSAAATLLPGTCGICRRIFGSCFSHWPG